MTRRWTLALTLLAACGGSEPAPAAPARQPATEATSGDEGGDDVVLLGALPDPAPPPPPEPETSTAVLPAARTEAAPFVPEPALAAGDAHVTRALAVSLVVGTQPTVTGFVDLLMARIRERTEAITAARLAYDRSASSPGLRTLAAIRIADACDAFAAEMLSVQVAMPTDVEARLAGAEPDVRDEVRAAFVERVREALAPHVESMFCAAVQSYRAAVSEGVGAQRAVAQLAAYGSEMSARCH